MELRKVTREEVLDTLATGIAFPVRGGRRGKYKVYEFNQMLGKRVYPQKKIEVIYIEEGDSVITVTLFVYYGKWD
jgi:hypothetical protein